MAITYSHVLVFLELRKAGALGSGATRSMLELGEQNWYGDLDPREIHSVIDLCRGAEPARKLHEELDALVAAERPDLFAIARLFYRAVIEHERYRAVDLHGTALAERHDLNAPLPFDEQFDVVTNIGTGEHVFNQYQVFRTIHARTRPGGVMYHSLPNQGCYDHGFYNYHPTFVHDLAQANGYQVLALVLADVSRQPPALHAIHERGQYVKLAVAGGLSNYSGLIAALRKAPEESPFRVPQQGYYDNKLPPELAAAWRQLPR